MINDKTERNVAFVLIAKYEKDMEEMEKDIGIIKGAIQRLKECVEENPEELNSLIQVGKMTEYEIKAHIWVTAKNEEEAIEKLAGNLICGNLCMDIEDIKETE